MKWIQSSIIIVSLTFLATCFAEKNEAAKSEKFKSGKAYNPSHSK